MAMGQNLRYLFSRVPYQLFKMLSVGHQGPPGFPQGGTCDRDEVIGLWHCHAGGFFWVWGVGQNVRVLVMFNDFRGCLRALLR